MSATIYQVLKAKLQREPTHQELVADVKRILREGADEALLAKRTAVSRRRGPR